MIRSIADLQQMKEAYLEKMGQYSHLCMVCYGTGCMSSGCKNVRDAMVEELEKVLDTQGDMVETQADPLAKSITVPGRCIQVLESTGNPVRKGKKRKEK